LLVNNIVVQIQDGEAHII